METLRFCDECGDVLSRHEYTVCADCDRADYEEREIESSAAYGEAPDIKDEDYAFE